jgi:hypothetical protein
MLLEIFPILGLIAFILLWTHIALGVFEPWFRSRINFDAYVRYTALIILACIILHPLLLLIAIKFDLNILFSYGRPYIWLGIIGWLLLITYDIGKVLQKHDFFARNWPKILLISTAGFFLIFFHSLHLGEDIQSGPLRGLWILFGVTAAASTLYTYVIKKQ